jgi:hypothetical protein
MKVTIKTAVLWLSFGFVCLLALATSILIWQTDESEVNLIKIAANLIYPLIPVVLMGVGALIVSRMPRHKVGWLLMLLAVLIIFSGLAEFIITSYAQPPLDPPLVLYAAVWYGPMSYLLIMIIVMLIALLFPTGKPPSPRWRWLLRYGLALIFLILVLNTVVDEWWAFVDPANDVVLTVKNPIGLIPQSTLETSPLPGLLFGILAVLSLLSLIVRYRRGGYVERQQMKWFLLACGLFVLIALSIIFSGTWEELDEFQADFFSFAYALGIMAFPIAIGIAILRYQLFYIDVIIRKTLVYTLLTGLLALIYLGTVIVLQTIIGRTAGAQSPLVIVLSTLLIAALFSPLRRRIQGFIDRRFYRKKYDAQQVLEQFGLTARDETEMERLTAELVSVVQETMQPEAVSIWLKQ